MEIKKCERCGCFYSSNENVCSNCMPKDKFEIAKLKEYFENSSYAGALNTIAANTGITEKNLNRYLGNQEFTNIISNKINL